MRLRLSKLGLVVVLLGIAILPLKKVIGQTADTTLSLALDSYTQANGAETGQLFAVKVRADIPTNSPIAGIDFTLNYDSSQIQAMKVLPGSRDEFENGYFGISSTVDTANSPCKTNPSDQIERLKCAIDNNSGTVAVSVINLAGEDFQVVGTDYPNPEVSGDITLATIIFLATDRKSTRLNSSHIPLSRMPSSA